MNLSHTQELFIQWNAEKLGITVDDSRARYLDSWKALRGGHGGSKFRSFCDLSYKLFNVIADDNAREIYDAYRLHAPMHFLRMLAHPDPKWRRDDPIVLKLQAKTAPITILDFGCGVAQSSRALAAHLSQNGTQVDLALADIPTLRKDFLLWTGKQTGIATRFLDCSAASPMPELPPCDICFAMEVFEHLQDPMPYFEWIHTAIKPNGLLITNIADHKKEFMHLHPNLQHIRDRISSLDYEEIQTHEHYQKRH